MGSASVSGLLFLLLLRSHLFLCNFCLDPHHRVHEAWSFCGQPVLKAFQILILGEILVFCGLFKFFIFNLTFIFASAMPEDPLVPPLRPCILSSWTTPRCSEEERTNYAVSLDHLFATWLNGDGCLPLRCRGRRI